jgi:hypothetical protein
MKSQVDSNGKRQATFAVLRTSSFHHAENVAVILAHYADRLQLFPPATTMQTKSGLYEVRVSYGTDIGGPRLLESLVALKAALNNVVAGTLQDPSSPAPVPEPTACIQSHVFVGLHRIPSPTTVDSEGHPAARPCPSAYSKLPAARLSPQTAS